ncbi:MAG: hypothetical protein ACP5NM_03690 [Thiomonas sp.]
MFFVFQNLLARLQPRRSAQAPAASRSAVPGTDTASISLMDVRLASVGIVLAHRAQTQGHSSVNRGGRP